MRRSLGTLAMAGLVLMHAVQPARAQVPPPEHPVFGHTMYFGTGFINTPSAYVPPSGLFVTGSMIISDQKGTSYPEQHSRVAGGLTLARILEVGGMAAGFGEYAAFGKIKLIRQSGAFPALAGGVMNLTDSPLGRFAISDTVYSDIENRTSIYAVASYVVGPGGRNFPSWVVISGGWGSGIFLEENPQFSGGGSGGLFGSVAFDFGAGDEAFIRITTEWDGFDLNLGATAWLSGLEVTIGVLALEEGGVEEPLLPGEDFDPRRTPRGLFYNQAKFFVSGTIDFGVLGRLPWVWTKDEE